MRRLIGLTFIIALVLGVLTGGADRGVLRAASQDIGAEPPPGREGAIKVTITTGGGLFGPAKDRYRVGERVPVVITMTNTGGAPVYVCDSSTLYQDRPQLYKDGRPVPYEAGQQAMLTEAERDGTCEKLNLPEPRLLRPGEPAVTDWFILSEGKTPTGDMAWYAPLAPGRYELVTRRRLACCEGPLVESDRVSFEVVP